MRPNGWYWIRVKNQPEELYVCEWIDDSFQFYDTLLYDTEVTVIAGPIPEPE